MPDFDDSKKQAERDARCDAPDVPRCSICGASVLRYGDTYYEYGDTIVCENCRPAFADALESAVIEIMALVKSKAMRHIREV